MSFAGEARFITTPKRKSLRRALYLRDVNLWSLPELSSSDSRGVSTSFGYAIKPWENNITCVWYNILMENLLRRSFCTEKQVDAKKSLFEKICVRIGDVKRDIRVEYQLKSLSKEAQGRKSKTNKLEVRKKGLVIKEKDVVSSPSDDSGTQGNRVQTVKSDGSDGHTESDEDSSGSDHRFTSRRYEALRRPIKAKQVHRLHPRLNQ
ncbi:hypothetical protein AKJ16_DCAP23085, partial [Drosera capensis]